MHINFDIGLKLTLNFLKLVVILMSCYTMYFCYHMFPIGINVFLAGLIILSIIGIFQFIDYIKRAFT